MSLAAAAIATAPVHHVSEIGSTNEEALVRARRGETGPLWIRADRQVAGRGRLGRVWASPLGNLYCSLMLRTEADPACLPQLSQVAAVALVGAIAVDGAPMADLRIKWPNDVLFERAKVAGILVEATRTADGHQACVIGCGINCASAPTDLPYQATSLAAALGRPFEPGDLFDRLRTAMAAALASWDDGRGYPVVRERWLRNALPLDTEVTVRSGPTAVAGRYRGIDAKGRLLLLGPAGPLTVEAGDVILRDVPAASGGLERSL